MEGYNPTGVSRKLLLDSLNTWPEGTRGHQEEIELIHTLNELCKKFGYGAVSQMAKWIEEVWRDPKKAEEYKKLIQDKNKLLM